MLALKALTLKVTLAVTPLVGILPTVVVVLGVVGVIHIVLVVFHHLDQQGCAKRTTVYIICRLSSNCIVYKIIIPL